jgi:6-phosphogluconolactonase
MRTGIVSMAAVVLTMGIVGASVAHAQPVVGAVYTASNATTGNQILVFARHVDGTLTRTGAVDTGGRGTGAGLGNQGGLVLSDNGAWLFAVNAASNNVSVFAVEERGLRLTDVAASGGTRPISIAVHDDLVYVLNAGSDVIAGFRMTAQGRLVALGNATRALSGTGTGPAEVAFSPNGRVLVVTEKNTNLLDVFRVDEFGVADVAESQPSRGATPFGFAFGKRDQVFVSEAFGGAPNASAVSAYRISRDGGLELIDGSVATNQTAACWVLVTRDGRFAFTTNTGSGSISGYAISYDGSLTLLNGDGRDGDTQPNSAPIDLASSDDGRFLYSLNSATGTVGAFRIRPDGQLTALPFAGGLPAGANGLTAR